MRKTRVLLRQGQLMVLFMSALVVLVVVQGMKLPVPLGGGRPLPRPRAILESHVKPASEAERAIDWAIVGTCRFAPPADGPFATISLSRKSDSWQAIIYGISPSRAPPHLIRC
ncbi:hypothetical protein [Geobacter sp.]|uniref:hypothetical protein n=1 Tax=Geobacter sp. TaxID=46610 RepID=UPI002621333E|nr:hypothetical protein [Geobacter sp.]